ncbi:unnamed protein product [Anisakis simplex]|uniref:Zinc finger protein 32 (inferred by orthology to a human protein) n=1 Tax=Anisakis simplex TaxID=6269 RepID=A0A0M3K2C7_ANISI|nr:unnamed protein product [Anisakis simplex]
MRMRHLSTFILVYIPVNDRSGYFFDRLNTLLEDFSMKIKLSLNEIEFTYVLTMRCWARLIRSSIISSTASAPVNLNDTCSYCDKSFTNQGNMQVHQRVHTGEKPFNYPPECIAAHISSSQVSILFRYKCNACDKSYAQKVGLKIHLEQCQQYLSNEGVISADEDLEKPNAIECLIPNILRIQDGAISLTPFQYSPQMIATERHDSTNSSPISIKPPTSSPFQTTQSPQTKLFAPPQQMPVSTPSSLLVQCNTNATISPPKATAIAQVHVPTQNIISPSAFHGIVSDPYKGSASIESPSFSHPQLVTLKRLLDGTTACSQFVPAQFLLPNQQLQLLLQSSQPSEQWCTNASAMNHQQQYHQNHQPMSHFMSNIPNGLSSYVSLLPQLTATFPGVMMQSGFVPPTIKNESSPMIV